MIQRQYRILIGDTGDAFATVCADILRKNGCWVVTRPQTADTLMQCIRTEHPDIILFNLTALTMDFPAFVRRISAVSDLRCIAFFTDENPFLERTLNALGVTCLLQPDDANCLAELLETNGILTAVQEDMRRESDTMLEITALLHSCRIPVHLCGFHYLRSAIMLSCRGEHSDGSCITTVYHAVAAEFNVSPTRVERGIRSAIGQAWQGQKRSACCTPYSFLQLPSFPQHKPTNSEFVAFASDWIRLRAVGGMSSASRHL